ncbi:hypothetical protein [Bartonella raoultii]|uniref:Phage related protein n=1 Tax=Bartonella raoultii TaxID=1457020 RepID=A0ABS7I8R0_9HYPH|nr:hypothetical protein [Bartonella raoultii]MBX4335812.1 hypothetical protein [Bartonella raoultii]
MISWINKNFMIMGGAFAAFFIILRKAFTLGKKAEQQKQTEKALKAAKMRFEVENEINLTSDTDVRNKLSEWMRDQ